jgi:hypothetical protein
MYLTQLLMNLPRKKMSELSDWLPDPGEHPSPGSNRNLYGSVPVINLWFAKRSGESSASGSHHREIP